MNLILFKPPLTSEEKSLPPVWVQIQGNRISKLRTDEAYLLSLTDFNRRIMIEEDLKYTQAHLEDEIQRKTQEALKAKQHAENAKAKVRFK